MDKKSAVPMPTAQGIEIDLSADVPEVTAETLSNVTVQAQRYVQAMDYVLQLAKDLEDAQKSLRLIETIDLPDAMESANMKAFTMNDSRQLRVVPVVTGSVKKENTGDAIDWLKETENDGIVKRSISIEILLPKGTAQEGDAIIEYLRGLEYLQKLGVTPKDEPTVHWATLTSWLKEMHALHVGAPHTEDDKPADCPFCDERAKGLLGIYTGRKAELISAEGKKVKGAKK